MRSLSPDFLPSRSSRLRGSLKGMFGRLRGCDRYLEVEGVRSLFLCVWSGSLKKDVWGVEGVRSLFGELKGCDRFWGVEGCDRCLRS